MRQLSFIVIVIISVVVCCVGYWLVLVDWVRDVNEGVYRENHLEAVLETTFLFTYTYLATRFTKNKLNI